jgi:hypothetical protein
LVFVRGRALRLGIKERRLLANRSEISIAVKSADRGPVKENVDRAVTVAAGRADLQPFAKFLALPWEVRMKEVKSPEFQGLFAN